MKILLSPATLITITIVNVIIITVSIIQTKKLAKVRDTIPDWARPICIYCGNVCPIDSLCSLNTGGQTLTFNACSVVCAIDQAETVTGKNFNPAQLSHILSRDPDPKELKKVSKETKKWVDEL